MAFTLKTKRKLVPKCGVVGSVGQTSILDTRGSSSGDNQRGSSTVVGSMGQMGVLDCGGSHSYGGVQMNQTGMNRMVLRALGVLSQEVASKKIQILWEMWDTWDYWIVGFLIQISLVDPAGDSAMRNSDLIRRMECSGSSLCQARKRALDFRLITNSTKATRGHLSIHVVSATSSCAMSSSKRRRVDIYHHNGNSSSLGARPMSTNDRPSTPIRTSIPLNSSTGYIDRSGPLSEYQYIDSCDHWCQHCGADFWYEERIKDNPRNARPKFHRCCMVGRVV
ncbi:hypothetical protein Tco_1020594, partial [Tanacetum coccineum]